ncbi:MAG: hypothetical protein WD851_02545 [Pirellulales bacterium]
MKRELPLSLLALSLLVGLALHGEAKSPTPVGKAGFGPQAGFAEHDFFDAIDKGLIDVKFIARNDHAARIIIANKLKEGVNLRLPEAFAGVPEVVLAQMGGGGFGGGGMGGGGSTGIGGGGSQGVGGGMGGGGGGMGGGGMGGGGGMFSVPPEKVGKINVPVVCLDHGKADPSSSKAYKIVPVERYVQEPAVVELLKAFGRGELQHDAAQAATWHLNNGLSWQELAAKQQGTARSIVRPPYFAPEALQAAANYSSEAQRLAQAAEKDKRDEPKSGKSLADGPEYSNEESSETATRTSELD